MGLGSERHLGAAQPVDPKARRVDRLVRGRGRARVRVGRWLGWAEGVRLGVGVGVFGRLDGLLEEGEG